MKRLLSILFHSLLFLLTLLAIDQAFVHLPMDLPGLRQSQTFYRDLRGRLLGMHLPSLRPLPPSIEQLIDGDRRQAAPAKSPSRPKVETPEPKTHSTAPEGPRYLYTDAAGQLQFVDRLEEIPPALRSQAKPLGR